MIDNSGGCAPRPGEWFCPECGLLQFGGTPMCRQCQSPHPAPEEIGLPPAIQDSPSSNMPGDWFCPACGDLQFARNTVCRRCQTPDPNRDPGMAGFPSTAAKRPGDWHCPACGELQFARNRVCRQCQTPNPAQVEDMMKKAKKDSAPRFPGDWDCPSCGDLQYARNKVCRQCQTPNPNPMQAFDRMICVYYLQGNCDKGNACFFNHGEQVKLDPWKCSACGFKNKPHNVVCGGPGRMGCKKRRAEVGLDTPDDDSKVTCIVHGYQRSPDFLEMDKSGAYRCRPGFECKGSYGSGGGPPQGVVRMACSIHGSQRSSECLMPDGQGGYRCKPNFACRGSVPEMDGIPPPPPFVPQPPQAQAPQAFVMDRSWSQQAVAEVPQFDGFVTPQQALAMKGKGMPAGKGQGLITPQQVLSMNGKGNLGKPSMEHYSPY